MGRLQILFLASLGLLAPVQSIKDSRCQPEVNCRLPDCRCWDDPTRPGNFNDKATPQIVALTFSQAINNSTLSKYLPLFNGLLNPNNCPARGTFFAQYDNTDEKSLKTLFDQGHEIGLTTSDGSIPKNKREWVESLFRSSEKLYDAGITRDSIKGARSPNMYMGGNDELMAEKQFGMSYEASCILEFKESVKEDTQMLWPYTYDFPAGVPKCSLGRTANETFTGVWQFLVPEMRLKGHKCSTLSSCSPYINTTADAFTLIYNTFESHYYKGRAPMTLYIDAQWLTRDVQVKGLIEFLQVIGRFTDTWMVTLSQALEWVRSPVPMYDTVKFKAWECTQQTKDFYAQYRRR